MEYPYYTRAEARKGVVHGERLLREMYTNVSSWAPGVREIYTCPMNHPEHAHVTPYQARIFYDYLEKAPDPELFQAGLALLDAVAEAYQEQVTVAFHFSFNYQYNELCLRMGPAGENHQTPEHNVQRDKEVYMYLRLHNGSLRAAFFNWPTKTSSYLYGDIRKITKRFLLRLERFIPLPAKAA